jgi:HEAT repeat protein
MLMKWIHSVVLAVCCLPLLGPPVLAGEEKPAKPTPGEEALSSLWHLGRKAWVLEKFLHHVGTVLEKNEGRYGRVGFAFDDDAKELSGKTVLVVLRGAPLRRALVDACRQLPLKFALDVEKGIVRFSKRGGDEPPPEGGSFRAGGDPPEPNWKPGPNPSTPERKASLRESLADYPAARADSFAATQVAVLGIANLETEEAAKALLRLYKTEKDYDIRVFMLETLPTADGREAAKGMLKLLARERDALLRQLLREGLLSLRTRASAGVILDEGLSHKDAGIRADAARTLGALRWKKALKPLLAVTRDRKENPRLAAVEALGGLAVAEVIEPLLDLASKKDDVTAVSALWALGETGLEDARIPDLALERLRESRKDPMRIQAAELLGRLGDARAVPDLLGLLGHKTWALRGASIRALAGIRAKEAVEPLIGRLEKETGRLAEDAAEALFLVTGVDIGVKAALWRDWWEKNGEGFEPAPLLRRGEPKGPSSTRAAYHSIPVVSKRVIFLLDVSGSMSAPMESDDMAREGSRLDFCREEMIRTIRGLNRDVRFNVLVFGTSVVAQGKSLVPASKANQGKAGAFLRGLEPAGATNLADALETAFRDDDVDTIYLLSDGEPTVGRILGTAELRRWVRRANGPRRIVLHTISAGDLTSNDFLKRMAEENGGKHVALK